MTVGSWLLIVWLCAVVMMTAGWLWQRRHSNIGIVGVLWAVGLGASAMLLAALGDGAAASRVALALFGALWGPRLALHLWHRVRGEQEDGRYRQLRGRWQSQQGKIFGFFQFQALLISLLLLPFIAVARNPNSSAAWLGVGAAIWLCSVIGEALADHQLSRFRANPENRGKTCREYQRSAPMLFPWFPNSSISRTISTRIGS